MNVDRRVQRTRRMLREALLELIAEVDYDRLTITNITERADLRRATFYLHYKTIEELLLDSLDDTMHELAERVQPTLAQDVLAGKTQPEAYRVVFEYVAENADFYRKLLTGQAAAAVSRRIRDFLTQHILKSLRNVAEADLPYPAEVIASYMAGAEVAMIVWWLENDLPHPPPQMAEMVHGLMLDGIGVVVSNPR